MGQVLQMNVAVLARMLAEQMPQHLRVLVLLDLLLLGKLHGVVFNTWPRASKQMVCAEQSEGSHRIRCPGFTL